MYFILFDYQSKTPAVLMNNQEIIAGFETYQEAKSEAEIYLYNKECTEYLILAACNDKRNQII